MNIENENKNEIIPTLESSSASSLLSNSDYELVNNIANINNTDVSYDSKLNSCNTSTNILDSDLLVDSDPELTNSSKNLNNKKRNFKHQNFSSTNILSSRHHPFTSNQKSLFHSYFYTNTNTILNKFVMTYEEQLNKAVLKGNYELCYELIQKKCDVNKPYNNKYPLCLACEYNNYEIAELLIKNGANVNQFDYYDQSCLIYAVDSGDINLIKLLIKNGADLNKCEATGMYPLHVAINRQNDEICDYLLSEGANINVLDKIGCSPLAIAINNDYLYMIDKLLLIGADPNQVDNNGDTPLIKAIWLSMSPSVENDQVLKIVKRLVDCGADLNAKNENGRTALFTAIYQNNTEIALYLIEKGAKCELEDALMSNFTLLHYACFQGNYVLAKVLLEKCCNPNCIATSCESPVYIAVTRGYADIVGLLVEYGADVNIFIGTDYDNKCTALQAALYYISDYKQFKNIVNKLLEGNADLGIAHPAPILYICLQYNKVDFAKYLVSVGANVEQRTIFNQSSFYKAFLNKNLEFMNLCVMAGFNLYNEPWINEYLENPDFIEYTDYYVKRVTNQIEDTNSDENSESETGDIMRKTDQEINDLLNLDEYYFERFHLNNSKKNLDKKRQAELARKIYNFIKYHYTNPLSLKELARIQVRKSLLSCDYKMKVKIENDLPLPKRLKNYLLLEEFNL